MTERGLSMDERPLTPEEEASVRRRAERSVTWEPGSVPRHVSDALADAAWDRTRLLATLDAARAESRSDGPAHPIDESRLHAALSNIPIWDEDSHELAVTLTEAAKMLAAEYARLAPSRQEAVPGDAGERESGLAETIGRIAGIDPAMVDEDEAARRLTGDEPTWPDSHRCTSDGCGHRQDEHSRDRGDDFACLVKDCPCIGFDPMTAEQWAVVYGHAPRTPASPEIVGLYPPLALDTAVPGDRYLDRLRIFNATEAEVRYALTALDEHEPGWREKVR